MTLLGQKIASVQNKPQFFVFTLARFGGLSLKPLILFVATLKGSPDSAEDYALLVSAVASLFVLTGGQVHIEYYQQRFGDGRLAFARAFRLYFNDSLIQFAFILPIVLLLSFAWTSDAYIVLMIIILVGMEKFFDEDQRHFLFTKDYYLWSLSFSARVILPSIIVLAAMFFQAPIRLVTVYTFASFASLVIYLVLRGRHSLLYLRISAFQIRAIAKNCIREFKPFWRRWYGGYAFNQLWSFLAINIYMIDRFWVAQHSAMPLAAYVFFGSVFNFSAQMHSLFYFTPRRPVLIRTDEVSARHEFWRWPNLLLPIAFALIGLVIALGFRWLTPVYADIPLSMLGGLGLYFIFQAAGMVVVETVFWRVPRGRLVVIDGMTIAMILGIFAALSPPIWVLPWLAAGGVASRIALYIIVAQRHRQEATS